MKKMLLAVFICMIFSSNLLAFGEKVQQKKEELYTPIVEITEKPVHGKNVTLRGVCRGWQGRPKYKQYTKSDWILEDETGQVYVSGSKPSATKDLIIVQGTIFYKDDVLVVKIEK